MCDQPYDAHRLTATRTNTTKKRVSRVRRIRTLARIAALFELVAAILQLGIAIAILQSADTLDEPADPPTSIGDALFVRPSLF